MKIVVEKTPTRTFIETRIVNIVVPRSAETGSRVILSQSLMVVSLKTSVISWKLFNDHHNAPHVRWNFRKKISIFTGIC